jgi:hypothetical protein
MLDNVKKEKDGINMKCREVFVIGKGKKISI